jgi:RNA polymerase sigma factor (sigma-70 family)
MEAPGLAPSDSAPSDCVVYLYEHYRVRLCRWAARILLSHADAEDVVQEAFLRLTQEIADRTLARNNSLPSRGLERTESPEERSLVAWLFHTVTRLAFNAVQRGPRRMNRESVFCQMIAATSLDPSRWIERERAIERVSRVLDHLPGRIAGILYFWASGKSHEEIASAFGMAPDSVRKALTRARRSFRATYRLLYKTDSDSWLTGS